MSVTNMSLLKLQLATARLLTGLGRRTTSLILTSLLIAASAPAQQDRRTVEEQQTQSSHRGLQIDNPRHVEVPEQQARLLFKTSLNVMAAEFHVKEKELEYPLTLVLGDPDERYSADEHGNFSIFLKQWDERKFISCTLSLGVLRLMSKPRKSKLVQEVLTREQRLAPVSAKELGKIIDVNTSSNSSAAASSRSSVTIKPQLE